MHISKLVFLQTPEQAEQFIRPFNTNITSDSLDRMGKVTNYGSDISSVALQGIAGDVLKPSSQHEGIAVIPNGWGNKRLRFFMEVMELQDNSGSHQYQIITGYTDHLGVSFNNTIDPNMRIYFNNTTTAKEYNVWGAGSVQERRVAQGGSSQILNGFVGNGANAFDKKGQRAIRPDDVFSVLSTGTLASDIGVVDSRTSFTNGPIRTHRNNTYSPEYLSRALTSWTLAEKSMSHANSNEEIAGKAKVYARDPSMYHDTFFSALQRQTSFGNTGYVTYGELCRMFNGLDNITQVLVSGHDVRQVNNVMAASGSAGWQGANYETVESVHLIQAIPSLMMECMLSTVDVSTTNDSIGNRVLTTVDRFNSFTNKVDIRPYVQHFIMRIENEFMPMLTRYGSRRVMLRLRMDLTGMSHISIQFDGGTTYEFVSPTFCDGVFSPLITNNQTTLFNISSDLNNLFNNVTNAPNNSFSPIAQQTGRFHAAANSSI